MVENDGHKEKIAASIRQRVGAVSNCCQSNLSRLLWEMAWGSDEVLQVEVFFCSPEPRQGSVSVVYRFLDSCLNLICTVLVVLIPFSILV